MGRLWHTNCRWLVTSLLLFGCVLSQLAELETRSIALRTPSMLLDLRHHLRGLRFLVQQPTILTYHDGPILTGTTSIPVYLIWYGNFSDSQRATIMDFFASTQFSTSPTPSVASWWKLTSGYCDPQGGRVPPAMSVLGEVNDTLCTLGKTLATADLETLVTKSLVSSFPTDSSAIVVVLTADDVIVEDFCNNLCASHSATSPTASTKDEMLPYGWVGNPASQCPGKCSWPFAQPEYGPYTVPLVPPNGDVGIDGMIINLAAILAGAATNPFDSGYYQGDGSAPLEAATACTGIFGPGAYGGYPGQLLTDSSTGGSFNAWGDNSRKYLLPALWDPTTTNCTGPPNV